jgi:UDP-glucose 4-epimerase
MILITGGMGFIGLHTARAFVDAGEEVVITYYRTWREPSFINEEFGKRVHVEQVDMTDREGVLALGKRHKITAVVQLGPSIQMLGPVNDLKAQLPALSNTLEASLEWGVQRMMMGSSAAIYSSFKEGPFREDQMIPLESRGNETEAYKKASEVLGLHFGAVAGLEVIAMRIGGIWGPGYHSMRYLLSRWAHAAVNGTEPDYTTGRVSGKPYEEDAMDLCYAKDCAAGIQLLTMAPKLNHRVYNVGHGQATSNREIADMIKEVVPEMKLELKPGRSENWRKNPSLDISRISADTGYRPKYTVQGAIEEYIAWLRENEQ